MKANELRIGNYVQCDGAIVRVDAIEYDEQTGYAVKMYPAFPEKIIEVTAWIDDRLPVPIQPIPLTEELLVRAGFYKSRNKYGNTFHIIEDDGFTVRYTIEHWTKTESEKFKDLFHFSGVGKVEHLHQLQNLYFALAGKELDVKLQ